MILKTLTVQTQKSYPIFIGHDLFDAVAEYCLSLKKCIAIITDDHLENNFGHSLKNILAAYHLSAELFSFPAGEKNKTRETKQQLEDALLQKQFSRDTCIIALGGGVVTDLAGFLAATFCRGVSVVYLPTSLLAMVDASIGGKTAVNTPFGKNLIGTFTQPDAVFIDTDTLKTLSEKEFQNGIVEMIKHGLIADESLFFQLQQHIDLIKSRDVVMLTDLIYQNCLIKKNIIEQDETESGMRKLLNFGHTIGHAIETLEDYQITHGEAVAIGLLVESYLATQMNLLPQNFLDEIYRLLKEYQLPLRTKTFHESFYQQFMADKKTVAKIPHFVLLESIGKPLVRSAQYVFPIENDLLDQALNWGKREFSC